MESTVVFENVEAAGRSVRGGGVITYAAEGVMGIGCDPFQSKGVERVIAIKGRAAQKGLIVLCATVDLARQLVATDLCDFDNVANANWPGPTTLILPAQNVSDLITGGRDSIALRVPSFEPLLELVEACGGFLISTSANLSGQPSAESVEQLSPELLSKISGIVPGEIQGIGGATSIIDARTGAVLR